MKLFQLFKTSRPTRRVILRPVGEHHHLGEILHQINHDYFDGKLDLHITWFNRRDTQVKSRIVLGTYNHRKKLIRIHRFLDQATIPAYFVAYIVYHEALHHTHPPIKGRRGKRDIHHAEYRAQEKRFKDYALAMEFRQKIKKYLFEEPVDQFNKVL